MRKKIPAGDKGYERVPPRRTPLTREQKVALANAEEPSAHSLALMPEVDFANAAVVGRGAEGREQVRAYHRARLGHPGKGAAPAPTSTKSIRFSDETWAELEARAKAQDTTLHALLREIIVSWLKAS